jgi:dihydropteroate synthase
MTRTLWEAKGRTILASDDPVPKIMGIVNVTPDSFSDGGRFFAHENAVAHALRLVADGADFLDVGGESTRPESDPVPLDEELRRVIPVIAAIAGQTQVPISIDTSKPEVARRALEAGACIINDVEGITDKPEMVRLAAETGAGIVIMHMAGTPKTMQMDPRYDDVVAEVYQILARRVDAAERGGIPRERIAVDPGIGFGKKNDHNIALLRNLERFANLGCVVLVGISRKGLLGKLTGSARPPDQLVTASAVASLAAMVGGAGVARVHDVGAMADAIKVWTALRGWS